MSETRSKHVSFVATEAWVERLRKHGEQQPYPFTIGGLARTLVDEALAQQWQPIETAPKEAIGRFCGPKILLGAPGEETAQAFWSYGNWVTHYYEGGADTLDFEPSHWMPLPAPPSVHP